MASTRLLCGYFPLKLDHPPNINDVPSCLSLLSAKALELGPSLKFFEHGFLDLSPMLLDLSWSKNIVVSLDHLLPHGVGSNLEQDYLTWLKLTRDKAQSVAHGRIDSKFNILMLWLKVGCIKSDTVHAGSKQGEWEPVLGLIPLHFNTRIRYGDLKKFRDLIKCLLKLWVLMLEITANTFMPGLGGSVSSDHSGMVESLSCVPLDIASPLGAVW